MSIGKLKIIQKILVKATPIEVYNAFLDPNIHSDFTGSKATGNSSEGSNFTAWYGYIKGKNLKLEKGKRIVQEWFTTEWPNNFSPSKLELTLRNLGDITEITMLHSDIPSNLEADLRQGWIDYYWNPLKEFFKKRKKG